MRRTILWVGSGLVLVALITVIGYGVYRYRQLETRLVDTRNSLASTTDAYLKATESAHNLEQALSDEQVTNQTFASQISKISSTVGTLDKLSKTDKELLTKYSKVYFLSEHYVPATLTNLPLLLVYPDTKQLQIHSGVFPALTSLVNTAITDGVDLRITSAYRSFGSQGTLKSSYTVQYGKGANAFSADQGYSEHQLGTTVDFTTAASKGSLVGFDTTPAFTWLTLHAHEYGFVLSYPKGNTYYQYEPWHWRYVGVALATRLFDDNEYFYDLEQREIDTYLVHLFDSR